MNRIPLLLAALIMFAGCQANPSKDAGDLSKEPRGPSKYKAMAYFRVAYQPEALVFSTDREPSLNEYEYFKNTQAQLLKNRFVLSAALRKPAENPISRLPIIKKQEDPVGWLMKNLTVTLPEKSEIIEICLTTDDQQSAADIVNAVQEAYMSEVNDLQKDKQRRRLSDLDGVYVRKEQELRNKRNELKQLAEQLGTAETSTLNLKQKLTLEELQMYRQELIRSESELGRLQRELDSQQAELKAVKNTEITDLECEMFAKDDPVLKNLIQEIMWQKGDLQYAQKQEPCEVAGEKSKEQLERLQKEYRERIDQIRNEIQRKRIAEIETAIKRLEASTEIARKQQKATEDEVQRLRKQAEQFSISSVDVEMLREDIENREKTLTTIATEREKLRIELNAPSRVIPLQNKVEAVKVQPQGTN